MQPDFRLRRKTILKMSKTSVLSVSLQLFFGVISNKARVVCNAACMQHYNPAASGVVYHVAGENKFPWYQDRTGCI